MIFDNIKNAKTYFNLDEKIKKGLEFILNNKDYLDDVLSKGAERASYVAYKTLNKVYKKVGLIPRKRG